MTTPKELIANGALVIDVRSTEEWNAGHLPNAKHLPVGDVARRLDDVEEWTGGDKDKIVVVYCSAGSRSGRARTALMAAGYKNVVNGGGLKSLL